MVNRFMFTKDELLVIEDALNIADEKYKKLMDENKNNKNKVVAYNRKQKKLWLTQNKLKKMLPVLNEKPIRQSWIKKESC